MLPGQFLGGAGQHLGAVRTAKLLRSYINRYGVPMGDVIDSFGGVYYQCRVMQLGGGGGPDDVTNDPLASGSWAGDGSDMHAGRKPEVLIAFPDGRRPHPFILGVLYNIKSGASLTAGETDTGTAGADAGKGHVDDYFIKRNGARLKLSKDGDIVLDSAERDRSIKLQVGVNGVLRIGAGEYGGDGLYRDNPDMSSQEFVLLGLAWLNWFNNNVIKAINDIGAAVNLIAPQVPTPPPGFVPHVPIVLDNATAQTLLSGVVVLTPKTAAD